MGTGHLIFRNNLGLFCLTPFSVLQAPFVSKQHMSEPRITLIQQRHIAFSLVDLLLKCSPPILHKKSAAQGDAGLHEQATDCSTHKHQHTHIDVQIVSPKQLDKGPNPL